ncbi:FAD-binding oxidoreductase [Roseateles violae]|uniref:FAD-binding oxidoreductase n=1 Tax=Roseateles violae TaxID=3058042 RepID=A0ABT8DQA3_9BURK|nr:FAD-binding oxidoreductase [Pelomonas sp. PFR6]MDN3920531.1 FAD-binding oxidoreductase [Pelomonas sp. PFR6]
MAGPASGAWDALAARLQGRLLRPGEADFDRYARVANARYDAVTPLALLRCAATADVVTALAFAREQKLPLVPRGGGHGYLGNGTIAGGLVIDCGPLDGVSLDGTIATVGAGAKLADVYEALIARGRCIASGSCVTVGIAGITQGGGFGIVDRAYGLSCDALLSARLVSADGRELLCDAEHNADLFWALRGGGGGQFGIVTEFRFATHAITPLTRFRAQFPLGDLPAVLDAWQRWPQQGLPDAVWSQLVLSPNGVCTLWGVAAGTPELLAPHWPPLLERITRTPLTPASVETSGYRELMLGDCAGLSSAQCHLPSQHEQGRLARVAMAASSDFFDAPLPPAGIAALQAAVQARGGRAGAVILNLMGGAIARVAPEATAFPHRGALFSAQYVAEYAPGTAAATLDEAAVWTHGLRGQMASWSSGRAYANYLDGLIANPGEAYWGANLARLRQIKAAIDPGGLFRPAQGL